MSFFFTFKRCFIVWLLKKTHQKNIPTRFKSKNDPFTYTQYEWIETCACANICKAISMQSNCDLTLFIFKYLIRTSTHTIFISQLRSYAYFYDTQRIYFSCIWTDACVKSAQESNHYRGGGSIFGVMTSLFAAVGWRVKILSNSNSEMKKEQLSLRMCFWI